MHFIKRTHVPEMIDRTNHISYDKIYLLLCIESANPKTN